MKPTLDEFKQWAKDCEPAARAVLMARVFAQMERERVNAYIRPIFDAYKFNDLPKIHDYQGQIKDVGDLYLCADDIQTALFYEDCDKAHRAHGFTGPKGHCPALRAEHLVIVTEQALMDLAKPLFGIDNVYGENRAKYLELLIGACLKSTQEAA